MLASVDTFGRDDIREHWTMVRERRAALLAYEGAKWICGAGF
jgi:hypothetical protein